MVKRAKKRHTLLKTDGYTLSKQIESTNIKDNKVILEFDDGTVKEFTSVGELWNYLNNI